MIELWADTEVTVGPDQRGGHPHLPEISDTSLILLTPGGPFEVDEARIRRIR